MSYNSLTETIEDILCFKRREEVSNVLLVVEDVKSHRGTCRHSETASRALWLRKMDDAIIEQLREEGMLPILGYYNEFTGESGPLDPVAREVVEGDDVPIERIDDIVRAMYLRDPVRVGELAERLLTLREELLQPLVTYRELEDLDGPGWNEEYEEGGALYQVDDEDEELDEEEKELYSNEDELGYELVWDDDEEQKPPRLVMHNPTGVEELPTEEGELAEDEHLVEELDALEWGENEAGAALYLRRAMEGVAPSVDDIVASIAANSEYSFIHNDIADYVPRIDAFLNAYFEEAGVGAVDTGLGDLSLS